MHTYQFQVSGAAAKSIKAKFVALFNTNVPESTPHIFPTPSQVCGKSVEVLRTAGLSQRKAEYILGLAEKFHNQDITTSMLFTASYEEVLEELIKVRGLGKWSVEMFACFGLKRMDVFSTGDLGVQRGMAAFEGRNVAKLKSGKGKWKYMSEKEMEEISEKFKPYRLVNVSSTWGLMLIYERSVYMWYMWRVEDVDISSFDN
jgi:DNA-3-methyladenine glycosylase II